MTPAEKNKDEASRYSIDVLRKWAEAMAYQWGQISKIMSGIGLSPERALKVGTVAIIDEGSFSVVVKRIRLFIHEAVNHADFDVSTLPEIRRLTLEALDTCRQKIAAKIAADLKAKLEHRAKLAEVLPKIVDEFGADVVQYGDPKENTNPSIVRALSNDQVLIMRQASIGSGSDDFQDRVDQIDQIDQKLKEILHRLNRSDAEKIQQRRPDGPQGFFIGSGDSP